MNTQLNAMHEEVPPAAMTETRPFYWSVRRELWENRYVSIVPLAVAGVALFAFLIATIGRALATPDLAQRQAILAEPYHFVTALIMGAAFIVGIFYSLEALHGERRDRSILFWKSLPVSDLTTVLAKASIPLLVLPILAFVITVVTQSVILLLSSMVLLASGLSVATLWTQLQLHQTLLMLLYHLVTAHMLWYAPFYAWLLLVSAWARRTPLLQRQGARSLPPAMDSRTTRRPDTDRPLPGG